MSQFNPYSEWLGIPTSTKPSYYQLLDIAADEKDLRLIVESAKEQLAKLKNIGELSPAKQKARQKLKARIRRAAKCLTSPELRKAYDARLAKKKIAAEAPPFLSEETSVILDDATSVVVDPAARKKPTLSSQYKQTQRSRRNLLLCLTLGLICFSGVAYLVLTQTSFGKLLAGKTAPAPVTPISQPENITAEDTAWDEADADNDLPNSKAPSDLRNENPDEDYGDTKDNENVSNEDWSNQPPPNSPQPDPPTQAELKTLGSMLTQVRSALELRDFSAAKQILVQALPLAQRVDDKAKLDRLSTLAEYVEEYWKALPQAWSKLNEGQEIMWLGQRSIIVEIDEDSMLLKLNGRNRKIQRSQLSPEMEVQLADSWFDANAKSTKVFKGAMMAVDPTYTPDQVRELWRQAVDDGVQLDDLELVLDDDYQLAD